MDGLLASIQNLEDFYRNFENDHPGIARLSSSTGTACYLLILKKLIPENIPFEIKVRQSSNFISSIISHPTVTCLSQIYIL